MAQRIGPPGSARVAVSGTHFGKPFANVFWCTLGGGTTASQAGFDEWNRAFHDAYYNSWKDSLSQSTVITSTQAVLFQATNQVLHTQYASTNGGLVSAPFVEDAAACTIVSWTSNAYWRGGKPRTYLPGVQQAYNSGNSALTIAGDTWYTDHGNTFHTAVNAIAATGITNTQHGFVHFFSAGVLLTPGVFYPITGATVHPRFGTQRRRLGPWIP